MRRRVRKYYVNVLMSVVSLWLGSVFLVLIIVNIKNMVLLEQIAALIDFIDCNREMALGYYTRTKEGRSLAQRRWIECSQILNSVAVDCPVKSPSEWRAFYNEYKSKLLRKIKQQKYGNNSIGGGILAKNFELTPLQERLYDILGRDAGEPLTDVRDDPLSVTKQTTKSPPAKVEADVGASTSYNSIDSFSDKDEKLESTSQKPSKRRKESSSRDSVEEKYYPQIDAGQAWLGQIELKNAEATMEHARATNNLAAAIDRLGTKVDRLISIFVSPSPKKRRYKIYVSSASDSE